MDREKVIEGLQNLRETIRTATQYTFTSGSICAMSMKRLDNALALLKEQEPLEPTRVEIEQAGPLYYRCYCKKCGHHVGNIIKNKVTDVHENFCSICGKAVKWE